MRIYINQVLKCTRMSIICIINFNKYMVVTYVRKSSYKHGQTLVVRDSDVKY